MSHNDLAIRSGNLYAHLNWPACLIAASVSAGSWPTIPLGRRRRLRRELSACWLEPWDFRQGAEAVCKLASPANGYPQRGNSAWSGSNRGRSPAGCAMISMCLRGRECGPAPGAPCCRSCGRMLKQSGQLHDPVGAGIVGSTGWGCPRRRFPLPSLAVGRLEPVRNGMGRLAPCVSPVGATSPICTGRQKEDRKAVRSFVDHCANPMQGPAGR